MAGHPVDQATGAREAGHSALGAWGPPGANPCESGRLPNPQVRKHAKPLPSAEPGLARPLTCSRDRANARGLTHASTRKDIGAHAHAEQVNGPRLDLNLPLRLKDIKPGCVRTNLGPLTFALAVAQGL